MLSCLKAKRKDFPKDAFLLRAGDTAESIGLVLSGSVLVIQEDIWGNRNILSKAGPGQTFAAAFACAPGSRLGTTLANFDESLLPLLDGLHTAIETSGYCADEDFARMRASIDLVMLDIKHPDPAAHRRHTGVDNAPILRHLAYLKAHEKPFIARVPLIPGVNDAMSTAVTVTIAPCRNEAASFEKMSAMSRCICRAIFCCRIDRFSVISIYFCGFSPKSNPAFIFSRFCRFTVHDLNSGAKR